jgi:uncharacterized protein YsxB (DUF464 family)
LDAIEEGEDGDVSTGFLKGHTRSDQRDMDRMGKRQELIVCALLLSHRQARWLVNSLLTH